MTQLESARLEALRGAPLDKWIALSPDESRVIAIADTYIEIAQKSSSLGEGVTILKTPPEWGATSL